MTKVVEKQVKCINCGHTSEQMIVYSVNFSLGSEESNKALMEHKQECPNCGYKASSIDDLPSTKVIFEAAFKSSDGNIKVFEIDQNYDKSFTFAHREDDYGDEPSFSELYHYNYSESEGVDILKYISSLMEDYPKFDKSQNLSDMKWVISLNDSKEIYSSNTYPENIDVLINYLEDKFYVKNGCKKITFSLSKENRKDIMTLFLINGECSMSIMHSNSGNISNLKDQVKKIKISDFNNIYETILFKTRGWEDSKYDSKSDVIVSLQIYDNKQIRNINCRGIYPDNWNDFIDYLVKIEETIYN